MTPRVCMVIERYAPLIGGSENQCRLLVSALHRAGVPVSVVTRRIYPQLAERETIDGVAVRRLPPVGLGWVWRELIFSLHTLRYLFATRRTYDILHLHSGTSVTGALVVLLAKLIKKKTIIKVATAGDLHKGVIEIGEKAERPSLAHALLNRLINRCLQLADRIVCISLEIAREAERHGFAARRRLVIPNAVDTQRFSPVGPDERDRLRNELGLPVGKIAVLFSGRLIQRKGVDVLLRAWYHLGALNDRGILLILGSGSSSLDSTEVSLKTFVQAHGLESSVRFVGETAAPEPYLRAADLYVFPSRREGMPNAVLEAMSTGLAVVASSIGGNVDLIRDGQNGLLFRSDDSHDCARVLSAAATDVGLRSRLAGAARRDMVERYGIKPIADRYISTYSTLIDGK